MKLPEPAQDRDELGYLPLLLTQLERPGVGLAHLRSRNALGGSQRHAQGDLQLNLPQRALESFRERLE
jgi:hypothetical protein